MRIPFCACVLATILAAGCVTRPENVADLPPLDSPGTKYTLLPTAVQRTITAMGGASEIKDINKLNQPIEDVYEVLFANPIKNPDLYIALDGSLINARIIKTNSVIGPTPTGRVVSGLIVPPQVQKTLQLQEPNATVANIRPFGHTLYEVTFVDPNRHPKLLVAEDGTVLKEQ